MDRRKFILTAGQAALAACLLPACSSRSSEKWLVSTCNDRQGQTMAAAINLQGEIVSSVNLPSRGHDSLALPHKPGHALVFCRRPERYAVEVDFAHGEIVNTFHSQAGTHFYGHGVLSTEGHYLFTTENLYDKNRGMIVVRDSQTYQVIDRFDSGGIGPHELGLMPDGNTLVVANGGIQTHPDQPRKKLNLDTMQPNIAYIDLASGKVLSSYQPPDNQLSLRHLDIDMHGNVYVGAQYQGSKAAIKPLLFSHKGQDTLQTFQADTEQWYKMNQYTASLLVKNELLYVSCPRGSHLSFWDTQKKKFIGRQAFSDVSGLAKNNHTVLASSGKGKVRTFNSDQSNSHNEKSTMLKFDNHMTMISAGSSWRPLG